ncbi:hypothetical protein C8Q80DRAFT_788511 [Daedaleopsis nitida]|nr:hypothetical protein C8Q80DRAFT_788511 [Daedaleopsis nitida]
MDSPLGLSKTLRDGLKLAATLRPSSQAEVQDLNFFMYPDLAQELAGTLVELAEDAVILNSPVSNEMLRNTLIQDIQTVIADMYALRCRKGADARGKQPELSIDGSRFILKLACDVISVLEKNAIAVDEAVVGEGAPLQFTLNMFRPRLSLRMMKWFQRAVERHASCQPKQGTAVPERKDGFDAEHTEIARLREELSVAQDEISRLKQMGDQDALLSALAQVRELAEEVSTLTAKVDTQSAQMKGMEDALGRSREQYAQACCDLELEQRTRIFAIQEVQKYMSLLKDLNQQMAQKESEIERLRNLANVTTPTRSSEVTIRLPPTPSASKQGAPALHSCQKETRIVWRIRTAAKMPWA